MAKQQSKNSPLTPGLIITQQSEESLSPAQLNFNRLIKSLETARAKHLRLQEKLDKMLVTASRDLMPLIEKYNQADLAILEDVVQTLPEIKLSARRRELLEDLVRSKAEDLLQDPAGLSEKKIAALEEVLKKFTPVDEEEEEDELTSEEEAEEFEYMCSMIEAAAAQAGVKIDLSDLDVNMDPAEVERILQKRLFDAMENKNSAPPKPARKQTKAQIEKANRLKEQEDAKKRDLKSLYKQLAKALHPDLETDPTLKSHKEIWMKRLTNAYGAGDLRELLQIEMEWLGEEASNLSTAGDEKLKIYCAVLKEQIKEQKSKTDSLDFAPEYFPLRRFMDPYTGRVGSPTGILRGLKSQLDRQLAMLEDFRSSGAGRKKILEAWADTHAVSLNYIPF